MRVLLVLAQLMERLISLQTSTSLVTQCPNNLSNLCGALLHIARHFDNKFLTSCMAKIKEIEYFRVPPRWLFVKVTDTNEKFGWGESTLEGHTEAVEGMLDGIRATILGFEAE